MRVTRLGSFKDVCIQHCRAGTKWPSKVDLYQLLYLCTYRCWACNALKLDATRFTDEPNTQNLRVYTQDPRRTMSCLMFTENSQ